MKKLMSGICLSAIAQTALSQAPTNPANPAVECLASVATNPALEPLVGKLVLSMAPKATLEMQALVSRASPAEKAALSKWTELRDECFEVGNRWLATTNTSRWFRPIVMQAKDSADALTASLYRGELTYGEFNVATMALAADTRKRADAAAESARLGSAPDTGPVAGSRNTLQQDLYQCQQEAARSYPPNMVQVMTSPGVQFAPPPMQTNCNSAGNQISCQSRRSGLDASIYNRPPTYVTEDSNLGNRKSSERSCMVARGYSPK